MQCSQRSRNVARRGLLCSSRAIWRFNMRCTRSPECSYACVWHRRAPRCLDLARFEARPFASRTSKNHSSRPVRLRPTARRRDAPRRPHRLGPPNRRGRALPVAKEEPRARVNWRQAAHICDPRPRTLRDTAGQPPPAAATSARPRTTSRSGTARHHRSDRRPNRGSQSTQNTRENEHAQPRRTPLTHLQTTNHRRRPRRSRAFLASILCQTRPWPPIATTATCTTRPSARRWPRRSH